MREVDAGKAISAMLPQDSSVLDYLEGIGDRKHSGIKVSLQFKRIPCRRTFYFFTLLLFL
jgi:hypothetical protein